MSSPDKQNTVLAPRRVLERAAIDAAISTIGLVAVSAWIVKILGPRSINPDYFCNCSVLEVLLAMLAWPVFAIACLVFAIRLRRATGVNRVLGVVAGVSAILFPVLAILALRFGTFPTIEELHGWAAGLPPPLF